VEDCGFVWRGRYPWDWHCHCGFSIGYTKSEREKLIDVTYERFKTVFGYYPRVFGSWLFDTHTARYIEETYGADAFCNCKEQYGTDGYTLWGGYYGQGYFPSRNNVFLPARKCEDQIDVPLFRMLGCDPVYQYDLGMDIERDSSHRQNVISLEPVYPESGGNPVWIDWYLRENFNGDCLSFGYAQAGQENSFGWNKMQAGLEYQFPLFSRLQKEGHIVCETLGESGKWYKKTYQTTPPSAITAHSAYDDEENNSVWYCTKYYRINLFGDHGSLRIRDLHILSDLFADPYENEVATGNVGIYESFPFIDGSRYSGKGVLAGGYICYSDGSTPSFERMSFTDNGGGAAEVKYGDISFELFENRLRIVSSKPFTLENRIGIDGNHLFDISGFDEKCLFLSYKGHAYEVRLTIGRFENASKIHSEKNLVEITFS
jgi:hypothetical protein